MAKKNVEKNVEKKQKKYNTLQLGFIILLAVSLFSLCIVLLIKEISGLVEQKRIMDEFNEYYESDELSIIFYSAEGCSFCEMQKPILDQIAKDYKLEYFDLDKTKLTEKQKKKILDKLDIEDATPTTVIVKKGKVISVQTGYIQGNKYVEFFVKSGILEEGSKFLPDENITFIDYEKFTELKNSKVPTVVVIGKATCENCSYARPILSNISKAYNIPVHYITLDYMSSDDRMALTKDLEELNFDEKTFVEEGLLHTPTTLIIQDSEIVNYSIGLGNITSYTKLFKETGVIKQ